MIRVEWPDGDGNRVVDLEHLVLDFNGTLAVDGGLLHGVADPLERLSRELRIHILTADTFGRVHNEVASLPVSVTIIPGTTRQDEAKRSFIRSLGSSGVCAIGNGRNDAIMVREAALGIAILQSEGAWPGTATAADVIFTGIEPALDSLLHPRRLTATLRI